MESDPDPLGRPLGPELSAPPPSPEGASELLRSHEQVRGRMQRQGPSRSFAVLSVWSAAVIAVYMAILVLSFSSFRPDPAGSGGPYSYTGMLIFPLMLFSSLIAGARERFGVRSRPSPAYWIAVGLVLAGVITVGVLSIAGTAVPWWTSLLAGLAAFAVLATQPLLQLRHAPSPTAERWSSLPLGRPVRWTTAGIGVVGGFVTALSPQPWFSIVAAAVLILMAVALMGFRAPWGLPRAGYEWGPIHWAAFGVAMTVMFALSAMIDYTTWITGATSAIAGAVVFLAMLAVSFLPTGSRE